MNSPYAAIWIRYHYFIEVIALGATASLQPACNTSCPEGYTLQGSVCVLSIDSGVIDSSGTKDSGTSASGNDADVSLTKCADSTFGSACFTATTTTDCGCDTGFCAAMPGEQGFCTHSGCLQDTSVCPSGWKCMDLSALGQPGLSICTRS